MTPPDSGQSDSNQNNGGNNEGRQRNRRRRNHRNRRNKNHDNEGGGESRQGRQAGYGRGAGGGRNRNHGDREQRERKPFEFTSEPFPTAGLFEMAPKGFGFVRRPDQDFEQNKQDVFIPPDIARKNGLRPGAWVKGVARDSTRGPQMV